MTNESLTVDDYTLTSSSEVFSVIEKIKNSDINSRVLIHIVSFIHNTVLVQNLKIELSKFIPNAKISFLKHDDKSKTVLTIYSFDKDLSQSDISDEILHQLHQNSSTINDDFIECKKSMLNKYFTDHLTGLPNLYKLRKDLQENENTGLIMLTIDGFETINNFYGFIVGDFVIEQISHFLSENIQDKVYRYSGVEFAILLKENMEFYQLKDYLDDLYKKLNNIVIDYLDTKIFVTLTLGSSSHPTHDNIFSKVSMALKYAKNNKLPFWIYEDSMQFENKYESNIKTSNMIRIAIEKSKIIPYFQPIIDNKTSKITKYECLARLIDEDNNVISPFLFIPVAKRIKVYNLITKIIVDKSFEAFKDNNYSFSINLSIEDIMNHQMFEFIIDKLKENHDIANRVIFEILESEAIQDFEKMKKFINEVKRYGAKIAIDDFGSGYSNFSYLANMSVDFIKIDGSLIKEIDVNENAFLVVETIVEFSKKLGIETIAEFVHSSTVIDKVKELKIDYSQGYFIDKPSLKIN